MGPAAGAWAGRAAQRSLRHRPGVPVPDGAARGGGRGERGTALLSGSRRRSARCPGPRGGRERPCGSAGAGAGCRSAAPQGAGWRDSLCPREQSGERGRRCPRGQSRRLPASRAPAFLPRAACAGSACLDRCNCWTESKGAADGLSSLARSRRGLLNYFHFALRSLFALPVFCFLAGLGSCFERLASLMGSCTVVIGIFIWMKSSQTMLPQQYEVKFESS